ncbi:MAG: antitoxin Xre-like helix-turn-helix domain-containing protein [Comamonas sp.]
MIRYAAGMPADNGKQKGAGPWSVFFAAMQDARVHCEQASVRSVMGSHGSRQKKMLALNFKAKDTPASVYNMPPMARISLVKFGIPAGVVCEAAEALDMTLNGTNRLLGLPASTIVRKIKNNESLSKDQGERVLQLVRLIGLTEHIVAEYAPAGFSEDFEAAKWLGVWLYRPQPSLSMQKPADYLDTATGRELIEALLRRIAVDAFA